jgi:hypothetical protein
LFCMAVLARPKNQKSHAWDQANRLGDQVFEVSCCEFSRLSVGHCVLGSYRCESSRASCSCIQPPDCTLHLFLLVSGWWSTP